ncbi:MAG: hypothetical protein GEV07_23225 [Streptosporangiales bacterium]|nr:hypothetical protein [Streptosporangiales bacterium]
MGRDNGLEADDFVFLGTVNGRLAEELLADLGAEGIAAYTAPANADEREHDERVYVDEHSLSYARALMRRTVAAAADTGEPAASTADADTEEAWARLVADFHRDRDEADDDPPWPRAEDVPDTDEEPAKEPADDPPAEKKAKVTVVDLDAEPDEVVDDDHYVRPEPPTLPKGDLLTKAAWAVMLVAVVYPITAIALDWKIPGWAVVLAVAGFVGGVVVHVIRIRDPHDDGGGDSDNGAVV